MRAADEVELNFSFTPSMPLAAGDRITFYMKDFGGPSIMNARAGEHAFGNFLFEPVEKPGISKLIYTVGPACVREDENLLINIPRSFNISLPGDGLQLHANKLRFSFAGLACPVLETQFKEGSYETIGHFTFSKIRYIPPQRNHAVQVHLRFEATVRLTAGDVLFLHLPLMEGESRCGNPVDVEWAVFSETNSSKTNGSWNGSWTGYNETSSCTDMVPVTRKNKSFLEVMKGLKLLKNMFVLVIKGNEIPVDSALGGITVTIPVSANIRVPNNGTVGNDPNILLGLSARDGSVFFRPPTPVRISDSIKVKASVLDSFMGFDNPKRLHVTGLSIMLKFDVLVYPGDQVFLSMPGFFSKTTTVHAFTSSAYIARSDGQSINTTMPVSNVSWNSSTQMLTADVMKYLEAYTSLNLDISAENNIHIAQDGVHESSQIVVSANLRAGEVDRTLLKTQKVGSFNLTSRLEFVGRSPTLRVPVSSQIILTFKTMFRILPDDQLILVLPLFSGASGSFSTEDTSFNAFVSGSWNKNNTSLKLISAGKIPAMSTVKISVPSEAGIRLPYNGIRRHETNLRIFSTAKYGPIREDLSLRFSSVLPIGSFGESTSLYFDPPRYTSIVRMFFAFRPVMAIDPGETISLKLPGFYGPNASTWPVDFSDENVIGNATWTFADEVVVLSVVRNISAGQLIHVNISDALKVRAPVEGLRINQNTIGMATDAKDGPLPLDPATPLTSLQGIGSFKNTSVDFIPRRAGAIVRIVISFAPNMQVITGDTISVVLRSVIGISSDLCIGAAPGYETRIENASWHLNSSTLVLTVSQDIEIDEQVSVLIPSSAGLMLPSTGLSVDTTNFTISTDAVRGPVPQYPLTYITESPRVGVLNDTVVHVTPGCAGEPSSLSFGFRPGMQIYGGDTLSLTFPSLAEGLYRCTESFQIPRVKLVCVGTWLCNASLSSNPTFQVQS